MEKFFWVHAEQGLGDSIQFYRFVIQARADGPLALLMPQKLARLFATQPDAPVIATDFNDPAAVRSAFAPMMSLPFLLSTRIAKSLPAAPYLRADPALTEAWRARLPRSSGKLRIGIVWASNSLQPNNHNRSIPLAAMLTMIGPDITIISLQKDVSEADRAVLRDTPDVHDLSDGLSDFADTAAAIVQLDLVITVCTSAASTLAGALGAPVWILLSEPPDWRWPDRPRR